MSRKLVSEMWKQIGHREPVTITSDVTIYQAAFRQENEDVGALIVTDNDGNLIGVLSERDIVRRVVAKRQDQDKTRVKDIMTSPVFSVTPMTTHDECKKLMNDNNIRHLPVVKNGLVVGMVSMVDIIRSDEYDDRATIEHLEKYIRS